MNLPTLISDMRIAVLMTCHNRCNKTLACLKSLFDQKLPENITIIVYLVDDGSTDGTSEAIASTFPQVRILGGNGSLFWAGGMRMAWAEALKGGYDAYLWLNDDTLLLPGALCTLCRTEEHARSALRRSAIIAGSCRDPKTKEHTYGGLTRRSPRVRLANKPVLPTNQPILCDTMNGNIVLVPEDIVDRLGFLGAEFMHFTGDTDYGLRARQTGIPVVLAPGYIGECTGHSQPAPWTDPATPLAVRIRNLCSPKGLPPRQWFIYVRRHTGWQWPFYFVKPLLRVVFPMLWSGRQGLRQD
jgi:GT2 family glycosyltransferase